MKIIALAAGILLSGGCRDSVVEPAPMADPGPAFAASSAARAVLGPGWRTLADAPHACFVSAATESGPIPYRYDRVVMRFPAGALAKDGAVTAFRYRLQGEDGKVYRVLNCVIPDTKQALHHLGKFFGVPTTQPDGVMTTQGCVTDPSGCTIPGIIAIGVPQKKVPTTEEPECSNQDYCWDELTPQAPPGEGGGGGGATTPCTTCGPSIPTLSCAPQAPVRGQPIRCVVTTGDGSAPTVSGWSFQSQVGPVAGPAGSAEWSGPAVAGGTVMAIAGGNSLLFTFGVDTREWRWGPAQWRFSHGTAPLPSDQLGDEEWIVNTNTRLGWNCAASGCGTLRRVQPDIDANDQDGYTTVQVQTGPNASYWYVSDRTFHMDRATSLNPTLLPTGPKRLLADPQARQCRKPMHVAPGFPVYVNQYEFNEVCMGVDMDAMIAGAWRHEEFGTTLDNGHEIRGQTVASQMQYDPWHAVEALVFRDEMSLRQRGAALVSPIQKHIEEDAGNHNYVKGNWSGVLWLWEPSLNQFTYSTIPSGMI